MSAVTAATHPTPWSGASHTRSEGAEFSIQDAANLLPGALNEIRASSPREQVQLYQEIAALSLSNALLATQRNGAMRWIERASNQALREELVELSTTSFLATQAISHVAPSRRDGKVLVALTGERGSFVLDGRAPFVTGVSGADYLTVGATLANGTETLVLVPTSEKGVTYHRNLDLIALGASDTGEVKLKNVRIRDEWILVTPERSIITHRDGILSRGYPPLLTSAVALGHARNCMSRVRSLVDTSSLLAPLMERLEAQIQLTSGDLDALASASQAPQGHEAFEEVRAKANACATRAADALMLAARGHGLLSGSVEANLALEANFFLVWSLSPRAQELTLRELLHPAP